MVGKVAQGAVDAGFVYVTDVKAAKGKLTAIALPANLQPVVQYGVAVVHGASHEKQAKSFVEGLQSGEGQEDLQQAGFGKPAGG